MANLDLVVIEAGREKKKASNTQTVDFVSVRVGASVLEIKEATGSFDFDNKKLTNIAAPTANGHALRYDQLGAPNGIATLDASSRILDSQLPNSLMSFEGVWDAAANNPVLANGSGNSNSSIGTVYRVGTAGNRDLGAGSTSYDVGDYVVLNPLKVWEKIDTTPPVLSVNGLVGAVNLTTTEILEGSSLYFTGQRVQDKIKSDLNNITQVDAALDDYVLIGDSSDLGNVKRTTVQKIADLASAAPTAGDALELSGGEYNVLTDSTSVRVNPSNQLEVNYAVKKTNESGVTISAKKVVVITENDLIEPASKNTVNLWQQSLGITAESIVDQAEGDVLVRNGAIVSGLSGLTPGKKYYVSSNGGVAEYADIAYNDDDAVYCVGVALSDDRLLFDPKFEFEY